MEPIFQTTFCQRYVFPEAPAPHVRRKLLAAGFRFDGTAWHRTIGTASTLSHSEMMRFLDSDIQDNRNSGLAPSGIT